MQGGMPTPDLSPIHKLLSKHAVPDDLVVVRLSSRAKRLIFKSHRSRRRGRDRRSTRRRFIVGGGDDREQNPMD